MIVGFKTGPRNWPEGRHIVTALGAKMCEVWCRADQLEQYEEPLAWFRRRNVSVGLHYWGICRGNILPNMATRNKELRAESLAQVKRTIDFAQRQRCIYVNIHPGAQFLEQIIFEPLTFSRVDGSATERATAERLMSEAAHELHEYASARGVVLTIETITRYMKRRPLEADRDDFYDPGPMPLSYLAELTRQGLQLANDITHTAAALPWVNPTRDALWEGLWDFTQRTAAQTRLVHINTLTPPYNGTDSHDGVTEEDWLRGVFPNREQVAALLALFTARADVFAVPEPLRNMAGNYQALAALAQAACRPAKKFATVKGSEARY